MGPLSREAWAQRLGAFRASPSAFLTGAEGEDLGRDLLSDLRSEKLSEQTKVGSTCVSYPCTRGPHGCFIRLHAELNEFLLNLRFPY